MRRRTAFILALSLGIAACGDGGVSLPTGPSPRPDPSSPPPSPPAPGTPRTFSQRIEVGDVVESRVTADDPLCDPGWPYRCRYYGLTVPSSGSLQVTIAWNPDLPDQYPLDMGVTDEQGREWSATASQRGRRGVVLQATAGTTYVIEVWSFRSPDEEFRLTTSIRP